MGTTVSGYLCLKSSPGRVHKQCQKGHSVSVIHVSPYLPSSLLSVCKALPLPCFLWEMAFFLTCSGLPIQGLGPTRRGFLSTPTSQELYKESGRHLPPTYHEPPACVYPVGTELNFVWCFRVNLKIQSRVWIGGCPKVARQVFGYHSDQVSLPLPSLANPLTVIRAPMEAVYTWLLLPNSHCPKYREKSQGQGSKSPFSFSVLSRHHFRYKNTQRRLWN